MYTQLIKNMTLQERYNAVVQDYITLFEVKHDLNFEYWIGGNTGELADFTGRITCNFTDIKRDIDEDVPKEKFFEWHELCMHRYYTGLDTINYKSFLMGYTT